jgi:preprotein translocase subunit SecG
VWCILIGVLILSKLGYNPLLILDAGAGFGDYAALFRISAAKHVLDSVQMLCFSFFFVFHIALAFLCKKEAWSLRCAAPVVFIGLYIIGLLPFQGTGSNMRYFLPVLPFVASALVLGASAASPLTRRAVVFGYSVVGLVLVLSFNVAWAENLTKETITRASSKYPDIARWLDNLRMPVHIALKAQIDIINRNVPDGSVLYWSSDYYKTATHGLAYHLGVKKTVEVRYVLEPSDPQVSSRPVFLTEFTSASPPSDLWRAPRWATAVSYGSGLFRLDPASIHLTNWSGDFVAAGESLKVEASVGPEDPYTVEEVKFVDSRTIISESRRPPFEMKVSDPAPGRHEIVAHVEYADRPPITSFPLVVYARVPIFERIAGDTEDLIEEDEDGLEHATQNLLVLDSIVRSVGIRFRNIRVGRGSRIVDAHLWFTSVRSQAGRTVIDMRAESSSNAKGLRLVDGDLSSRPATSSHVTWETSASWTIGQYVESPDLAPILEEVFSREDWQSGNSILLLIQVSGKGRLVQAASTAERYAPRLQITLKQ